MKRTTTPRTAPVRDQRRSAATAGDACALLLAALAALALLAARPSAAAERIDHVTVAPRDGYLYVSAALTPGLASSTDEDLRKGLPKDLYYYLVLKQRQRNWFDEELVAVTVKYGLKYDLLKQEYVVSTRLPSGTTHTVVRDFAAARELVSRVDHVPVADVRRLSRRKTYVVSVKAEMKAPRLPLYLDYFFFFIPFLDITTEWRDSAPFRAPDAR
ncbi:MAG: DUF4390 domain-containing protein [Nitrospirota bacterium]